MTTLSSIHGATRFRPMALWIDTLCIPVAPHLKEYRKLAIRLLGQTFYDAKIVLVLDRELCSVESQKVSDLELGIRIVSGGWVKRLWTLQEAAVSIESKSSLGKMYFQMGDGPVRWNKLLHTFQHMPSRSRSKPLPHPRKPTALASTVQEIKGLLFGLWVEDSITSRLPSVSDLQPRRWDTQFQRLARAVQNRTTSKSEDEAICLASLAGLDLSNILSVQTAEERMQQFYLLLREIPAAIIFVKLPILTTPDHIPTPNMKNAPFRWAPRSLLLHLTEVMNVHFVYSAQRFAEADYRLYGICEPNGLHIEQEGFVFRPDDTILYPTCVFEDVDGKEQYCLTWYGTAPDSFHREVALIFETTIRSKVAIVRIEKRCGHENAATELYATIIGHGSVSVHDELVHGELVKGTLTPFNQKWCLT
ncbi:hypothetical protein IW262DRAFT_335152 [Armillaria fumosa]|nr:hypothetical protein IW262DRAFT_335152 [Armillaria fumosa]